MHGPICTKSKQYELIGWFVSCMTLAAVLTRDLGNEFRRSNLKIAIFSKCLTSSSNTKKSEFFGCVNILFVNKIWYMFSFHHMLQCRPDVKFLSMEILVWSYHYCDGDFVYLRHNTCLGAVLDFTSNTHRSYMKFTQFFVTRTQKLCKLSFMIYHICLKIIEMRTGWWSNSVRHDHTVWGRVKMERGGRIQYCKIQQWITLKINTKFWNGLYIPTHLCVDSFESHVRLCNWNLIYSVRQTGDMHSLWVEDWPKRNYSLRCVQWIG